MANSYFQFKQFTIQQNRCAMKVTTDACLFGAWCAHELQNNRQTRNNEFKMLDVGVGTGLLSLMVAQKNKGLIDAIEIQPAAANQAIENVAASPWAGRLNVICTDVLKWQPPQNYNCIFSNPPFYENDLLSSKPKKNLAYHDKGLNLAALILFIRNYLKEDGDFFLLLPAKRLAEAANLLAENALHINQTVLIKQTPAHAPFRVMIKGSKEERKPSKESSIIIKDSGAYTLAFNSLLKDYYLYL